LTPVKSVDSAVLGWLHVRQRLRARERQVWRGLRAMRGLRKFVRTSQERVGSWSI